MNKMSQCVSISWSIFFLLCRHTHTHVCMYIIESNVLSLVMSATNDCCQMMMSVLFINVDFDERGFAGA